MVTFRYQKQGRPRVVQDLRNPFGRIVWIQRDERTSRSQTAEHSNGELRRNGYQDSDQIARCGRGANPLSQAGQIAPELGVGD